MAVYGNAVGVKVTCNFKGKTGLAWANETWSFGQHFAWSDSAQGAFPLDSGDHVLNVKNIASGGNARTLTNYTVTPGWSGEGGANTITDDDKDSLVNVFDVYLLAIASHVSNSYVLDSIKVYPWLSVPGPLPVAPDIYTPKTPGAYATGATLAAPQLAAVVSTSSALRGRKGRGRWYLGSTTTALQVNGLMSSATQTAHLTAATNLLNGIRASHPQVGSLWLTPVIAHQNGLTAAVINKVRVGDEIDTQQRRRRQRAETYVVSSLT